MKSKKKWKEQEIKFLLENYPKYGISFCSDKLGIKKSTVINKVFRLHLKVSSERKSITQSKRSIKYNYPDANVFINIKKREVAYIMGFLWADGYLSESNIILEINKIDLDEIKHVFFSVGEWRYDNRFRKNRKKESASISCSKKEILNIFKGYNYQQKSLEHPVVLDKISNDLKKYFFRGLIDGDGNFYVNKKTNQSQFCLAGTYNQNWGYFEELLKKLDIKYTIRKARSVRNEKINQYSIVRVTKRKDIIKLGEYIYEGFKNDKIGLGRKYSKVLLMKQIENEKYKQ